MKQIFLSGGSRGIGWVTKTMLETRGDNVVAPSRGMLDFNSTISVKDYLPYIPPSVFNAIVFCHGEWYSKQFETQDELDHIGQYRQRVLHPFILLQRWLRYMPDGGVVIMVASTRGFIGGVMTAPYSLACAAQIAMMQGFAREYPKRRFNVVCPSLTKTDMGVIVKSTGGAKADAVPQSAESVVQVIVDLIDGDTNGEVVRVVDGQRSNAKWSW